MALYDTIGRTYAQTRSSDPRIAAKLLEILMSRQASTIVDIGAGTGSYALVLAEHGYRVLAVEPSATMQSQVIAHPAIEWIEGYAENLPLFNQSADAAIIMLALHHFQNYQQALYEVHRVTGGGQIVLFTYDPAMISEFWLTKYFPSFVKDIESTFLPIPQLAAVIQAVTGMRVSVVPFPLPQDLSDAFAAVGWARPELYFNSIVRHGISSFAKITDEELQQGLSSLREDLEMGVWEQKYGQLRQLKEYDVGYRFLYTIAAS
ncbi:MAG: methyltransferase domain-containing protein [Chroococcidiopsidaceae cyanobacterium CP_BM_ER_R8_30]|nr:methyltransferase domain-containing protein [Chroococcidiopsidaceae cyanobacterium CP_BM_ER_R8_30]